MQEAIQSTQPAPSPIQPTTPPAQPSQPTQPIMYTVPHHADHRVLFVLLGIVTLALFVSTVFAVLSSSSLRTKIAPTATVDYSVDNSADNPASDSAQTTRPFELAPIPLATDSAAADFEADDTVVSSDSAQPDSINTIDDASSSGNKPSVVR